MAFEEFWNGGVPCVTSASGGTTESISGGGDGTQRENDYRASNVFCGGSGCSLGTSGFAGACNVTIQLFPNWNSFSGCIANYNQTLSVINNGVTLGSISITNTNAPQPPLTVTGLDPAYPTLLFWSASTYGSGCYGTVNSSGSSFTYTFF